MKSIIVITKSVTEELITKELIAGNLHLYVRYVLNTEHEAQAIIEITTVTIELIKFIVPTVKNSIYFTSFIYVHYTIYANVVNTGTTEFHIMKLGVQIGHLIYTTLLN